MTAKSRQIICIALLPFVLCAAVASLDALVLCTAGGHEVAIEVTHSGQTHCLAHRHDCQGRHPGGDAAEIRHAHKACNDIHLRLNLGDVKDHRVQVSLEAEAFGTEAPEKVFSEIDICLPGQGYSLQRLRSVVLQV